MEPQYGVIYSLPMATMLAASATDPAIKGLYAAFVTGNYDEAKDFANAYANEYPDATVYMTTDSCPLMEVSTGEKG